MKDVTGKRFGRLITKKRVGKTLDRWPNRNGNYEPGNVRWATGSEQARNRNPRKVE